MQKKPSLERGVDVIQGYVKTLGSAPGVYRMLDERNVVLYIGKAKNLKKRVTSYTRPEKQTIRIQRMISLTRAMEFVTTHTEGEALLLEASLIKSLTPRYNILFRDDKSFPYILLTGGDLPPALTIHRGVKTAKGDYFGPFASSYAARKTLEILSRVFKLRTCTPNVYKNRSRPCLQYYIKRCTAPCVNKVSAEEYAQQVENARQFLQGKTTTLQKRLAQQMEEASMARFYERAAQLRDQIQVLTKTQEEQGIYLSGIENLDVIALIRMHGKVVVQVFFFRNGGNYGGRSYFPKYDSADTDEEILEAFISWFYAGATPPKQILINHPIFEQETLEKMLSQQAGYGVKFEQPKRGKRFQLVQQAEKNAREVLASKVAESASTQKILEEVARIFGLPRVPKRIEVYDNSHHQGSNAYGVMIVATPDGFEKKSYRRFGIKNIVLHEKGGDDYAMMREVLSRRFYKADPENFPDLVLLDGGKGQLSAALQVMQELGVMHIPVAAIAKGPERNAGREKFFLPNQTPFSLEPTDPVLYYLQRLRDEAHRFAIGTHRQKKQKGVRGSQLDGIKGIGAKRKKDLLQHFGSVKAISEAGVADLKKVVGISQAMAQIIYDFFH
jgi:excinuclease ABC subunit C